MTTEQKLNHCINQLLYNEAFLSRYDAELDELLNTPAFMQVIDRISSSVSDELEFSVNPFDSEFSHFKKKTISNTFFTENLRYRFPAFDDIVCSVTADNMTALSATISVYFALRYLELSSGTVTEQRTSREHKIAEPISSMESDLDFRQKWKAEYRCDDGHYVRSKNEQLVDNWLYTRNICHAYEPMVVDKRTERTYISDFYLPQFKLYIEVWGMETQEYLRRKQQKIEVYQANNKQLLQITDREIKSLDDFMRKSLTLRNQ